MNEDIFGRIGEPLWVNQFGHLLQQGARGRNRLGSADKLTEDEVRLNRAAILLSRPDGGCAQHEIIVRFTTNRQNPTFDLRPYKHSGHPGWVWELWEVGQRHWNDSFEDCRSESGNYGYGFVDENGTLVGLRDEFTTKYTYTGYLILSQGNFDCTLGGYRTECSVYKYVDGRLKRFSVY